MLLQATNLTIKYGTKYILDHENLYLEEGQKIGVVGSNGQGKSTLLSIIASLDEAYGSFSKKPDMKISYLPQLPDFSKYSTIQSWMDQVVSGDEIYRLKSYLTKFNITDFTSPIAILSGGQQKRMALAYALCKESDLLILDEPTNHLDMKMIVWLEKFLQHFKGAILMVTHDRYFLDRITGTIIEVNNSHLYLSEGGYSGYLEASMQRRVDLLAKQRRRASILRTETAWAKAGIEARRTKSKDRLERWKKMMNEKDVVLDEKLEINLGMNRLGRKLITFDHVTKSFDDQVLFTNFSYQVQPYDRIGILGDNGVGKSTLLNLLCGKDFNYEGSIIIGDTVKIGYFDQLSENLDGSQIALKYIQNISDAITTSDGVITAKQMMSQFLFDDDAMYLPISRLSGGQKRRLYLLSILIKEPNVLILDEPTNDLDIETLTVLEDFLDSLKGVVITVSHDRYFLDKVVDKMFVLENQEISIYNGNCSDYLDTHTEVVKEVKKEKAVVASKPKKVKLTIPEQRELASLTVEIEQLETKIKEITEQFNDTDLSYAKIQELTNAQQELEDDLELKTLRWMELSEKEEG